MYMFPLLLFFSIFFARFSTTYDSRNCTGKYIVIKNCTLAKLLVEKASFFDKGKYTLQKDRNKMSVIGLIFYLCNVFVITLFGVLLLLPQIPCAPLEIDATKLYLYADTVNTKIPIVLAIILLCVEFLHILALMFRYRKEVEQKWIKGLIFVLSIVGGLACGTVIIEMLFELFKW